MSANKDEWKGTMFIGLGLAGLGLGGALAAASGTMGAAAIPVWFAAAVIVAVVMRSPIIKAMAQKLEAPSEELGEVGEQVYAELDELRARLLEIEERQDFSERLLTDRSGKQEVDSG